MYLDLRKRGLLNFLGRISARVSGSADGSGPAPGNRNAAIALVVPGKATGLLCNVCLRGHPLLASCGLGHGVRYALVSAVKG